MKCIYCKKDCKKKERPDGNCPSCKRLFAFEPTRGDKLTDVAFQSAVDAVSADGRLRWGVEHLFYEVNRRVLRKRAPLGCIVVGLPFVGAFALGIAAFVFKEVLVSLIVGVTLLIVMILVLKQYFSKTVRLQQSTFDSMWQRWLSAHGKPAGVIERVKQPPPLDDLEGDIAEYSFDRAVICDRARTVDLLLANNFHFENNCAVLSIQGYPEGPFEIVRKMLKRNPKLVVIALHDASLPGCRLAHRLSTEPGWFPGGIRIIDVGLRPVHAERFKGLFLDSDGPLIDAIEGISEFEAKWLSRYKLELAAIRPEQILKRLYAALNRQAILGDKEVGGPDSVIQDHHTFAAADGGGGDIGDAGADGFG